jgi:hypothetical protein
MNTSVLYLKHMVHVYNNALIIMQDEAHDQVLVAFNIWDVTATSLGIHGILEGFHAKTSLFAWRKSTSELSYLVERSTPMHSNLPSGSLRSTGTTFVPSVDSKDPTDHLELGATSAVSP